MSFLAPERLLLLVVPVFAAVAYLVALRRRGRYAVRFTNLELLDKVAPERPGWRRHLPAAALLVGLVVLTIAFARPTTAVQVARQEATVVLGIDVSLSMEANDVEPTRIEAAKEAAQRFLELAPQELQVGVVAFSGSAAGLLAPTTDRVLAEQTIAGLTLGEGTAIGEGIFTALQLVQSGDEAPVDGAESSPAPEDEAPARAVVILSDGETTMGRPDVDAAAIAAEAGVPVSTISFGTSSGVVVIQGETIPVPVNEGALRQVASETGGTFYEAATADELQAILDGVGEQVGFDEEQREVTDWFAGAGLLMTLLAGAGSLLWFSRLP